MLGWVLCSASLISRAPIIACGGHRSPLHGRGHAALIRGEADWIPRSWKIGDKRRDEEEWVRHLCCQTLQLIEVVVCVWWVQFQSLKPFFFYFYDSKDIKDDFFFCCCIYANFLTVGLIKVFFFFKVHSFIHSFERLLGSWCRVCFAVRKHTEGNKVNSLF